jgi:DNA-directed RNA polymerase beta subunit
LCIYFTETRNQSWPVDPFVRLGSWVETGDILVGKLTPHIARESSYIAEAGLLRAIFGLEVSTSKETSLKLPIGGRGRVIDVKWIQRDPFDIMVRVYILQKREIKVGWSTHLIKSA